jgi:flagellar biosynthetic protein FliR
MLSDGFINWLLVFSRVGALLALLPLFSAQNFPVRLRVALSGLLALLLSPFLAPVKADVTSIWGLIPLMGMELSVGLLLGFVCRMVFFALETGGSIMATEMGLTMPSEFSQITGTNTAVPSAILYWMALMLWLNLDLHHWMIVAVQRSYDLVPVGGAHLREALLHDVIRRTSLIFVLAVQISAPVIGVSFVLSLVFSLLARAVPQMNVFTESMPVRTLVGLIIFGSTCLFMAQHITNCLRHLPEDMLQVTKLMAAVDRPEKILNSQAPWLNNWERKQSKPQQSGWKRQ